MYQRLRRFPASQEDKYREKINKIPAVALDKCSQFLKNPNILGRAEFV